MTTDLQQTTGVLFNPLIDDEKDRLIDAWHGKENCRPM